MDKTREGTGRFSPPELLAEVYQSLKYSVGRLANSSQLKSLGIVVLPETQIEWEVYLKRQRRNRGWRRREKEAAKKKFKAESEQKKHKKDKKHPSFKKGRKPRFGN